MVRLTSSMLFLASLGGDVAEHPKTKYFVARRFISFYLCPLLLILAYFWSDFFMSFTLCCYAKAYLVSYIFQLC